MSNFRPVYLKGVNMVGSTESNQEIVLPLVGIKERLRHRVMPVYN